MMRFNKPGELIQVDVSGTQFHLFYRVINDDGTENCRVVYKGTFPEIIQKLVDAHQKATMFGERWRRRAIDSGYKFPGETK